MVESILMYGSIFSPILGLYIVLSRRILNFRNEIYSVFILLLVSFLGDLSMWVMALNNIPNMPIAHIYGWVEAVLIFHLFSLLIRGSKTFVLLIAIAYSVYYVLNSIFVELPTVFNSYARSIEALLVIMLAVIYFYQLFREESDIFIENRAGFWVVVAFLAYFSGALFSFLLSTDILSVSPDRFYGSWILHNASNILKNAILAISLWKFRAT